MLPSMRGLLLAAATMAFVPMYCGLRFMTRSIIERCVVKRVLRTPPENVNGASLQSHIKSSSWSFLVYTCLSIYGLSYIIWTDWLLHPSQYVHISENPPAAILAHYYMEALHYTLSFAFLILAPRGKDFTQMFVHHCTTLVLISMSYKCSLLRYGVVVMVVHDVCDPFLEMAKICRYLSLYTASNVIFVAFSLVFFSLRLVAFPLFVIKPALGLILLYKYKVDWIYYLLLGGLVLLLSINVAWMFQIAKIVFAALSRRHAGPRDKVSAVKQK